MARRIVFTGGSGRAGKHAVTRLEAGACDIRELDPKPLDCAGGNMLITAGTDPEQAFGAVSRRKCV